jgi:hypothetical protein
MCARIGTDAGFVIRWLDLLPRCLGSLLKALLVRMTVLISPLLYIDNS